MENSKIPISNILRHFLRVLIVLMIIGTGFVMTVATGGGSGSSNNTSSISASAD
jgi:hypothetical protein